MVYGSLNDLDLKMFKKNGFCKKIGFCKIVYIFILVFIYDLVEFEKF